MKARFLLPLLLFSMAARGESVRSYLRNEEGVAKFKAKSYYPAYQDFLKALEEEPLNAEVQLNMAVTFEANEENEKAEAAYKGALRLIPDKSPRQFETLFNLGGVLAKQKKYDEALETYQAALELQPESLEVKTNIELMEQQGGGGGSGKNDKDQKDKKDQNKKDQGQDQKDSQDPKDKDKDKGNEPQKEKKQQPKPFQSQELSPQDVKKILDEIKNQEQSIRAQEYERNVKEAPRGKDW